MINNQKKKDYSKSLVRYKNYLVKEERSANTISKYIRDLGAFYRYLEQRILNKGEILLWKDQLIKTYTPASVNSMLAAVNGFLKWAGYENMKVKPLKIQREIFAKPEKELTEAEYRRLVQTAEREGDQRLSLILQTICSTGIRVSELKSITAEAIKTGRAMVSCKGKIRTVFLPAQLCRSLGKYCREQKIRNSVIFRTKSGKPLDRSNIWRDMQSLCKSAGVKQGKVFPHNLRHLFARTYYRIEKDLSRLADLLGHSSVNTKKIYIMESGKIHTKQLNRMDLVLTDCITT